MKEDRALSKEWLEHKKRLLELQDMVKQLSAEIKDEFQWLAWVLSG